MTNQSHTELAAQARRAAKSLEILDMENTAELMRQCAAALESPERVQWEAWPTDLSSNQRTQPERFSVIKRGNREPVIDDDDFKFDALIVVHGDFGDGEKEKYVAEVCRRLNASTPPTAPAQDAQGDGEFIAWLKTRAADSYSCGLLVKDALARLSATPSPQAEKQPLSDEWIRSMCKQGWVFDTVKQWVRVTEAAHGIVTKESSNGL